MSKKKRKRVYNWLQSIEFDPRPKKFRKIHSTKKMRALIQDMGTKDSPPPVILSLLKKQHLGDAKSEEKPNVPSVKESKCIMKKKLKEYLNAGPCKIPNPKKLLSFLNFTPEEIEKVDRKIVGQWRSESWFLNKKGFITASN